MRGGGATTAVEGRLLLLLLVVLLSRVRRNGRTDNELARDDRHSVGMACGETRSTCRRLASPGGCKTGFKESPSSRHAAG